MCCSCRYPNWNNSPVWRRVPTPQTTATGHNAIVQLELAKWPVREVDEEAADLHRQYKLATADAVVYATARESGADLLTCDTHFENLPGVVLVKK